MKKFGHLLFVACAGFMCYGGVLAYNYATQTEDERFMLANIEALTNNENINHDNYSDCLSAGGNWNMASVCQESGFEKTTCKIT